MSDVGDGASPANIGKLGHFSGSQGNLLLGSSITGTPLEMISEETPLQKIAEDVPGDTAASTFSSAASKHSVPSLNQSQSMPPQKVIPKQNDVAEKQAATPTPSTSSNPTEEVK